jgi:hypothetical protein
MNSFLSHSQQTPRFGQQPLFGESFVERGVPVGFWGAVFYDARRVRREECRAVNERFGALGYGNEGVVREGCGKGVERACGLRLRWGFDGWDERGLGHD